MTKRKTFGQLRPVNAVRRIGREYRYFFITHEWAEYVLWNHTGFPTFWMDDDMPSEMEAQLREFFEQERLAAQEE